MTVKQIIEQELKRNPDNWIEVSSERIEKSYRNNDGIEVKEFDISNIFLIIMTATASLMIILIGISVLI